MGDVEQPLKQVRSADVSIRQDLKHQRIKGTRREALERSLQHAEPNIHHMIDDYDAMMTNDETDWVHLDLAELKA